MSQNIKFIQKLCKSDLKLKRVQEMVLIDTFYWFKDDFIVISPTKYDIKNFGYFLNFDIFV